MSLKINWFDHGVLENQIQALSRTSRHRFKDPQEPWNYQIKHLKLLTVFHSFLFGPQTQVRNIKVRILPAGPHLRSATFGPQFTRPSVRKSAVPHFTHTPRVALYTTWSLAKRVLQPITLALILTLALTLSITLTQWYNSTLSHKLHSRHIGL